MLYVQNMFNMSCPGPSSTSRALGRSALQHSGHVCPRRSCNRFSDLIRHCITRRSAYKGTALVLIICILCAAYIEANLLEQPLHYVPMARLPVCFIADARDAYIVILNSQIKAARIDNMKLLFRIMSQKLKQ